VRFLRQCVCLLCIFMIRRLTERVLRPIGKGRPPPPPLPLESATADILCYRGSTLYAGSSECGIVCCERRADMAIRKCRRSVAIWVARVGWSGSSRCAEPTVLLTIRRVTPAVTTSSEKSEMYSSLFIVNRPYANQCWDQ